MATPPLWPHPDETGWCPRPRRRFSPNHPPPSPNLKKKTEAALRKAARAQGPLCHRAALPLTGQTGKDQEPLRPFSCGPTRQNPNGARETALRDGTPRRTVMRNTGSTALSEEGRVRRCVHAHTCTSTWQGGLGVRPLQPAEFRRAAQPLQDRGPSGTREPSIWSWALTWRVLEPLPQIPAPSLGCPGRCSRRPRSAQEASGVTRRGRRLLAWPGAVRIPETSLMLPRGPQL